MRLGNRTAENREVLGEHIDHAAIDGAPACHHAVAGVRHLVHPEIDRAVGHEHVELFERAIVEQQVDAFARCQLALRMLRGNPLRPTPGTGHGAALFQLFQNAVHGPLPKELADHNGGRGLPEAEFSKFAN